MNDAVAAHISSSPLLVVISGPTAVGKDAVLARLRKIDQQLDIVVTATTRPPRADEVDGKDYHFLSDEEFRRRLGEGEFLEHAEVYPDEQRERVYLYGVLRAPVRESLTAGRDVIMRVDARRGAATIREKVPGAVFIFLAPPSRDELKRRMQEADRFSEANFEERWRAVEEELACIPRFDYCVVNERGRLNDTVEKIRAIMCAEKSRVGRKPVVL